MISSTTEMYQSRLCNICTGGIQVSSTGGIYVSSPSNDVPAVAVSDHKSLAAEMRAET